MSIRSGSGSGISPDELVANLIEMWCDRRAIRPLRFVLPAWPHNGLTDGIADLANALRRVLAMAKQDLTEAETTQLLAALAGYDRVVNRR